MAPLPQSANHPCALNPNPPLLPLNLTPSLSLYLLLQAAKLCDPAQSYSRLLFPAPCSLCPVPLASTPAPLPPSSPCRAGLRPHAAQAPMPRRRQPMPPPCGPLHCAVAPDRQAAARAQRTAPPAAHRPPRTRPASHASAAQPENRGPSPHFPSRPEQHSDHPSPQWLEPQQDSRGRSPPQSAPRSAACRWFAMGLSSAALHRRPRGPRSTRRPPRAASATEAAAALGWRIQPAEPK